MTRKIGIMELITCLIVFTSCQSYDQKRCEGMAMKIAKGNTYLTQQYNSNCLDQNLDVSLKDCQYAFKDLVAYGSSTQLKKKFGSKILGCFKKKELSFLLDPKDPERK